MKEIFDQKKKKIQYFRYKASTYNIHNLNNITRRKKYNATLNKTTMKFK